MKYDFEQILYEGYAREEIEIAKLKMNQMETDELKELLERSYPAGFLEKYGLVWKVALKKIAVSEILKERGFEISLDVEKCKSVYKGYVREEIEIAKLKMNQLETDELTERLERPYPDGYLEDYGLGWKISLENFAALEILDNRKKYNNISLDYFIDCYKKLELLLYHEDYKEALSFANTLLNAKVLMKSSKEELTHLMYCTELESIIHNLEIKLQVKSK